MLSWWVKMLRCFNTFALKLRKKGKKLTHKFNVFAKKNHVIYYEVKTGKKRKITDVNMSGFILQGCTESIQSIANVYPDDWLLCIGYEYRGQYDCQIGLSGSVKEDEINNPSLTAVRECKEETGIEINIGNIINVCNCPGVNSYTIRLDEMNQYNITIVHKINSGDTRNKIQLMIHGTLGELRNKVKQGLKNLRIYNPDGIDHFVLMPICVANKIATDITNEKKMSNFKGYKFGITFRKLYNIQNVIHDIIEND